MMVVRLPLDERDPRRRLERVVEETRAVKRSHQALGMQTLEELSDRTFTTLLVPVRAAGGARAALQPGGHERARPAVPGLRGGGAHDRVLSARAAVPRTRRSASRSSATTAGSYWGFNADWDALPDLHELVEAVAVEFALLRDAASGVTPEASSGAATSAGS